jgi:protein-L-isoaspartate(D-aspartate) O-methyltransferase
MEAAAQAKAAFQLRMRARGIRDLDVLRALEIVPREKFVAHRYVDLAGRDLALPIGCGQTLTEPWLVARMIEALEITRFQRILEIGTGSGYATAILAQLAVEVVSIERFQSLAIEARARLDALRIDNAAVVWGDGLAVSYSSGSFDRVIVHGHLDKVPERLDDVLAADGVLVMARGDPQSARRQIAVRLSRGATGEFNETTICPCRLQAILPGIAQAL